MESKRTGITFSKFRTSDINNKKTIEGTFIVFNKLTNLYDDIWEEIAPEAIESSLNNVRALYNHNMDLILGTTANGTLRLSKTSSGLRGIIEINQDDPSAMGAYARIKRGDIKGCSFGFMPLEEEYRKEGDKNIFRVTKLELYEVSPCVFPAYPQTTIEARKADLKKQMIKQRSEEIKAMRQAKSIQERKKDLINKISQAKEKHSIK